MPTTTSTLELFAQALIALAILVVVIPLLLALVRWLLRRRSRRTPCAAVPEIIDRRPDPCIYSQFFILQFLPGQPVTWDNPDIVVAELDGTPVSSFDLKPAHDYVIQARIWDASFSPALGTLVRCSFHGFGFNSLNTQPVETNADGSAKVVVLHIAQWQNATAEFRWRTPPTPGHYCVLVECSHPADSNTWNNLGQENTVIRTAQRGETVTVDAIVANQARDRDERVRFVADAYTVPEGELQLRLRTTHAASSSPADGELRVARRIRSDAEASSGSDVSGHPVAKNSRGSAVRYAYEGKNVLMEANAAVDRALPNGWQIPLNGQIIELAPGAVQTIPVSVEIPADAALGPISLNVTSMPERGRPGGITIRIHVVS